MEKRLEEEIISNTDKPLTRKEIEKLIRSEKLTEQQAIQLCQRYMDSLEYNDDQQFVTCCGGIRQLPVLLPINEEE